jgi:hypothetical protein
MKVAYIFSTTNAHYILSNMIIPQLEGGQHGFDVAGMFFFVALNRMGFPEGFSCRHSNPIRYIVGEASHPVNSATVARSPRESVEIHRVYSVSYIYLLYIQSCNIVSHCNGELSRPGHTTEQVVEAKFFQNQGLSKSR